MKSFLKKIKWSCKNCKIVFPFIIILIAIGTVTSILSVYKSLIIKSIIDSITLRNGATKKWLIILASFMLLQVILNSINSIISTYANSKLKNKIQENLYNKIIKSKWQDLSRYHSVDILTRFNNDVTTIVNFLITSIPETLSLLVMLISSFIALLTISKTMSLFAICIFPVLIILSKFYGRKLHYFYTEYQKKESKYSSFLQECFNNILIVKSFTLEKYKSNSLKSIQKEKLDLSMKKSYFQAISSGLLSLSASIGYFAVLVWGALNISSGASGYGSLTAMIQLFGSIQSPIYCLTSTFPQIISSLAAIDRLIELENLSHEDYSKSISNKDSVQISFKNISYSYDNITNILNNISLKINRNDIIGIVGPSGGGKTTLIRILQSLIYPSNGEVYINNEILNVNHRKLFSYVPQGNTLFSGTIRENLTLSNTDISDDDIYDALRRASAYDFVINLKDKLETVIGEKSIGLSEGQAQRLCIARALLKRAPLLILDESTSSLDRETEIEILKSIKDLNNCTCIIITHRLNALAICNKVYEINNSTIKPFKKELINNLK